MKKIISFIVCIFVVFLNIGCHSTKTRAVEGAVIGGVIGAGAGGIIGHQKHRRSEGAGIGAAVGAITGAIVGSQIEKSGQANQSASPSQNSNPVLKYICHVTDSFRPNRDSVAGLR